MTVTTDAPESADTTPEGTAATGDALPRAGHRWAGSAPSVLPALAMLAVGGFRLSHPALGWDENATWMVARRSVGQIVDLARHIDGVIAPYYLFMHAWVAVFGDSEVAMRAPSLLAVAIGVGVAGELGRRLFGARTGLGAGLLLVAVPQLSRYAQDARAYGLAFLFATGSTLALVAALRRPTPRRWSGYAAVVALLGLTHLFALLILVGHAVAVADDWHRRRDRRALGWLPATVVAVLPAVPLMALGIAQRDRQLAWIGRMDAREVLSAPGDIVGSPALAMLLVGLALAVRYADRSPVRALAAIAVLPPAVLMAVSFAVPSSLWVPRYALFVLAPLTLLAAVTLRTAPWRLAGVVVIGVALTVPAQAEVRGPASHQGLDLRRVAAVVRESQVPGDGVVFGRVGTWSLRAGFDYQLRSEPAPRDLLLYRSAAEVGDLSARECPDLAACLGTTARVWYVGQRRTADPLQDQGIRLRALLQAGYRQENSWLIPNGTVALYVRR